ncbi:MAG TPA: AMP-binding protein [Acidimicrobiales bacterium]|jgi:acyl-CoA synthetase (AMP-forming)/AMP-acid ligase II|nr:AMP-binding protein [Acidimicrobiales bacterium]
MSNWNYADVWDAVAATVAERPALQQGEIRRSWAELETRAASLATTLREAGLGHQAKVSEYLYNCPAYIETLYACFKAGLVPVNTNYRYTDDELVYLWENSDTEAVVFHGTFAETVERLRPRLADVKLWLHVDDGSGPTPEWAHPYEVAATRPADAEITGPRPGDDYLFIYTGGTTGMPKGVMWRQDDLFATLNKTAAVRYPESGGIDDVRAVLAQPSKYAPPRMVPGPPLMHGTGLFTAMTVLSSGGSVVLPEGRHLDVPALLDLIETERVTEISIVGDAFAKPILAALDAEPDRWDISSLWLMVSSGVMWSAQVKEGLLRHQPKMTLVDTLGSSEAIGMARSTSRAGQTTATAGFSLGPDTKVLTEDGREVQAGSEEQGRVAIRGRGPMGYYKDPGKSATTFMLIDGERWTIPGDFAMVRADGSVHLLGRGSVCINTGGEKVFPEEVEEAIKLHPSVADAVVVGVPDDRFGETVTAVVERRPGATGTDDELIDWVKGRLAAYKAPRRIVAIPTIGRSPSGKVDYRRLRQHAIDSVGAPS